MNTAQGRKKTRKKKCKKPNTRKRRKNHALRSHNGGPPNKVAQQLSKLRAWEEWPPQYYK